MKSIPTQMQTVDARSGKVLKTETIPMRLLPPRAGLCAVCAVDHPPEMPHNPQSLYWQMAFNTDHGRAATWADAVAHCTGQMRAKWELELKRMGAWSVPPDGAAPIATPYSKQT
jgi:hypothetical protein